LLKIEPRRLLELVNGGPKNYVRTKNTGNTEYWRYVARDPVDYRQYENTLVVGGSETTKMKRV